MLYTPVSAFDPEHLTHSTNRTAGSCTIADPWQRRRWWRAGYGVLEVPCSGVGAVCKRSRTKLRSRESLLLLPQSRLVISGRRGRWQRRQLRKQLSSCRHEEPQGGMRHGLHALTCKCSPAYYCKRSLIFGSGSHTGHARDGTWLPADRRAAWVWRAASSCSRACSPSSANIIT